MFDTRGYLAAGCEPASFQPAGFEGGTVPSPDIVRPRATSAAQGASQPFPTRRAASPAAEARMGTSTGARPRRCATGTPSHPAAAEADGSAESAASAVSTEPAGSLTHSGEPMDGLGVEGLLGAANGVLDDVLARLARCAAAETLTLTAALARLLARLQGLTIHTQVHLALLRPPQPAEGEDPDVDPYSEFAADELAAELAQSPRAMSEQLATSWEIAHRLPDALAALTAGSLDRPRLMALYQLTQNLSDGHRALVEQTMLAGSRLACPPQWRRKINRLVAKLDPGAAARRRKEARAQRGVSLRPLADGMAQLTAVLTAEDALAIYDRITQIARTDARLDSPSRPTHTEQGAIGRSSPMAPTDAGSRASEAHDRAADHMPARAPEQIPARAAGHTRGRVAGQTGTSEDTPFDRRTLDNRRADVLAALLLGNRRELVQVEIQVIAPVGTLAGLENNPAELVGYGPIPAQVGRALAADANWRRVLTDPANGTVLDLGHRRVPSPALARLVRHQQSRCVYPGCGMPATRTDIDHTRRYASGGHTALDNLGLLCRHHHRLRHESQWSLTQVKRGVFVWSSPAGRAFVTDTTSNDEEGLLPHEDRRNWTTDGTTPGNDSTSTDWPGRTRRCDGQGRIGVMKPQPVPDDSCPF
jgi:hypothetical protein